MAKPKDKTLEQGPIWVAASGLTWQEKPTLDADEIIKLRENYYWAGVRQALANLVYRERATVEVLDKDLNPDEEKTTAITRMVDRPEVDLWSKLCMVLPDWYDWGIALFNDVWGKDGQVWTLKKLRRLPPELFSKAPFGASLYTYSEILKGITLNDAGEPVYYATDAKTHTPQRIENVTAFRDPTVPDLAGRPMIRPVVSVVRMLDFAWTAQMQQLNRVGAPIMFIRMEKWSEDDLAYAQQVLANWGKDTGFTLRAGMELVELPVKEGTVAQETIQALAGMVVDFFSPAKLIGKDGTLIGGSAAPELDLLYSFVAGIHRKLETNLERLLQPWLDLNGWSDYTVKVHIPSPAVDRSELNLKIAAELRASGLADPARYLALLGEDGYSREEIEEHAAWWAEHGSTATAPALGFANLTHAREADAEDLHGAIAGRTLSAMDKELNRLKKDVAGLVEGE
jgi:hypothetical protein